MVTFGIRWQKTDGSEVELFYPFNAALGTTLELARLQLIQCGERRGLRCLCCL